MTRATPQVMEARTCVIQARPATLKLNPWISISTTNSCIIHGVYFGVWLLFVISSFHRSIRTSHSEYPFGPSLWGGFLHFYFDSYQTSCDIGSLYEQGHGYSVGTLLRGFLGNRIIAVYQVFDASERASDIHSLLIFFVIHHPWMSVSRYPPKQYA